MSKPAQRGVALVTALLILALAALIASGFIGQTRLLIEATQAETRAQQALALAQGLQDFAVIGLLKDADKTTLDSRSETWAQPLPPLPIPNGALTGYLEDLDGRINVNGFAAADSITRDNTRFLLDNLLVQLKLSPQLAREIEDAIDIDDTSQGGAEDNQYLALRPPRRAPNRALRTTSELLQVNGIDAKSFQLLRPHVAALNPRAKLNINTASIPVLMSLHNAISPAIAARLHQDGSANASDVSQWIGNLTFQDRITLKPELTAQLSIQSRYFLVHTKVLLDSVEYQYVALLDRNNYRYLWTAVGDF